MGARPRARRWGGSGCQIGDMEFPARGAQERREVVETLGLFEPTELPLVGQRPVGALVAEDMLYAWRFETGNVGRSVLRPACGVLRRGRGRLAARSWRRDAAPGTGDWRRWTCAWRPVIPRS